VTKTDVQSDLLADLQVAAGARPLPATPPQPLPTTASAQLRPPTPALDLRLTPLRWQRPGVVPPATGMGLGLRLGPVQLSLSLRS
jgi:hypothetical protein